MNTLIALLSISALQFTIGTNVILPLSDDAYVRLSIGQGAYQYNAKHSNQYCLYPTLPGDLPSFMVAAFDTNSIPSGSEIISARLYVAPTISGNNGAFDVLYCNETAVFNDQVQLTTDYMAANFRSCTSRSLGEGVFSPPIQINDVLVVNTTQGAQTDITSLFQAGIASGRSQFKISLVQLNYGGPVCFASHSQNSLSMYISVNTGSSAAPSTTGSPQNGIANQSGENNARIGSTATKISTVIAFIMSAAVVLTL